MRFPDDSRPLRAAVLAAATLPSLLAFNVAPSPTFLNQALAFITWGLFAWAIAAERRLPPLTWPDLKNSGPVLAALVIPAAAAAWSSAVGALPASLSLSAMGTLSAAMVLVVAGAAASRGPSSAPVFAAFCAAWIVAGVLNALVAALQVFVPTWTDGDWIAHSSIAGRAVGNLRQPNHLSSLLMWAAIAVVGGRELRRLTPRATGLLMAILVFAIVLTASRTGVLGVVLLALWGLADRRLLKHTRALLLSTPLMYLAGWLAMAAWASVANATFGGQQRLAEPDLSASRFAIWSDTLALIQAHPWFGVGFGEFNFAWSLSVMPHRPTAFFDHTHSLPLQLAVELGVPLAGVVLALLVIALWRGAVRAGTSAGEASVVLRCAVAMLVLIGLHSLLEYPLWYSYFLLPTAWIFGIVVGGAASPAAVWAEPAPASAPPGRIGLALMAAVVVGAGLWAVVDYTKVVSIFTSDDASPPLQSRIARGRQSVLFSHHADYAAATVSDDPAHELGSFDRAAHYLLDTRLMTAWAQALAEAGDRERASYLAQRLREFRNPQSAAFFAACGDTVNTAATAAPPFQCVAPAQGLGWRDFQRLQLRPE